MNTLPRKVIGMSNTDYHASNDFLGRSFLHSVARHGGAAQRWMDLGHPLFAGSSATRFGTKFDGVVVAMCEGNPITDVLSVPPADVLAANGHRRGKAYEAWKENEEQSYRYDCSAEEFFQLSTMAEHLMANDAARQLVEDTVETQVSIFFDLNGQRCKVRPDGCTPQLWWDLKTTSATWDELPRSVSKYGYTEQEWFYVQGAMAMGMDHFRMPFVFVQSMAPYECRVFYLPVEWVEEAGRRMTRVMEEVRLRRETGVYDSSDAGEITELVMPPWSRKTEEELAVL